MKIIFSFVTVLALTVCMTAFKPANKKVTSPPPANNSYRITVTSGSAYLYLNSGVQPISGGQSYIVTAGEGGAIGGHCGNSANFCVSYGSNITNTSGDSGPCYDGGVFTFQAN